MKTIEDKDLSDILLRIASECKRARSTHGIFHSTHEAYGVIKEEFEEWWDSVKDDEPDDEELISVAAMAVLAIKELKGQNKI